MDKDHRLGPRAGERLLEQLDPMVETGQVTETEAARLLAASDSDEFENAARDIRVRHAGAHLDAAVESGQMTQEDATSHLERVD